MVNKHEFFLQKAIDAAVKNTSVHGGPFGAIITKDGEIIAEGVNRVTDHHDPTAHAEVMAIREACKKLNAFELKDCVLYSSCEPCPMCLGAIYWARLKNVYYAADRKDAAKIQFDDDFIYNEIEKQPEQRTLPFIHLSIHSALDPFKAWAKQIDKKQY
ncbi:nucleoside deaminase [Cytobacillus horneckiae]|uniref:nucleoside deaminase n=1 Tax=Cytobacillus horneckiae TaxID=549687 RepID=UPI002041BEFC|nr:nucleoside deaminase [Cytobacillus horneckiae]MCM3180602.1 nucleoside deaminase [Cytobacillus horneckiae]